MSCYIYRSKKLDILKTNPQGNSFGGHQNAQFNDAIATLRSNLTQTNNQVIKIAILDGVLYIKGNSKMYRAITTQFKDDEVIISSILLRDYIFSL